MGLLQCWDCLCSFVTSCVLKVYLNEKLETLGLFLHQSTHTHSDMHTHEPIHMHSQQVICRQNQHLKRYINLRLTSAWSCSSCHQCQVCGEPAARRVTVRMIKGAIRTLVILQITASWARKKKKKNSHIQTCLVTSSFHLCTLKKKNAHESFTHSETSLLCIHFWEGMHQSSVLPPWFICE